jgi:hypothetical protein
MLAGSLLAFLLVYAIACVHSFWICSNNENPLLPAHSASDATEKTLGSMFKQR